MSSYRSLFGLRRAPTFLPHILLNAGVLRIINNRYDDNNDTNIEQSLEDLKGMAACHGVAGLAMDILDMFRQRWEPDTKRIRGARSEEGDDSGGRGRQAQRRGGREGKGKFKSEDHDMMEEEEPELCHSICSSINIIYPSGDVYCCLATGAIKGVPPMEIAL